MLKVQLPILFEDGKMMYDAVLAMIHRASPVLATLIHDNPFYNPFSLQLPDIVMVLGLELEPIFKSIPNITILEEKSHLELLDAEYNQSGILLDFFNVTFRSKGFDCPLPVPEKILLSLKERWNQLYPEKISIHIPFPGEKTREITVVKFMNIHTRQHKVGDYPTYTVFYGKVGLQAFGSDQYIHDFNVLMRFAEWAGVGYKRQMGMGVTKILASGVKSERVG
ncbi:CRISPR system precrRNA processing endoribonuclease RAMP protein Cas6 [Aneurinibacillus thermoaerophilus]|uniref:CRISPR system precrRNA processing endoribonuclease RAMP protein Cas6 n=1 Tax=Aneurinibacillus thermoaerophilus TaxID=143495 RepID=UPI002E1B1882|nr:CRISPR system precrRNA processing endoribonuclease RAMP protein Cas6 [Aneurinibacillus thermoaerophilus]